MKNMISSTDRKTVSKLHGKALSRLRHRIGLTQAEAAERANTNQQTWARWETGANNAFLDVSLQTQCVQALGFTLDDLASELDGATHNRPLYAPAPIVPLNNMQSLVFPLDGTVKGGTEATYINDDERPEAFDLGRAIDKNTRILRVVGDSMSPILESGSYVTYDKTGVPRKNHLCVIRFHDGQYFIKRYRRMSATHVEAQEIEAILLPDGRTAYIDKDIFYPLNKIKAVYPAGVRFD